MKSLRRGFYPFVSLLATLLIFSCDVGGNDPVVTNPGDGGNPGGLNTYSFSASIVDSQIINAETASYLDSQKNTHIVWIQEINDIRTVKYTLFDKASATFSHKTVYSGSTDEMIIAPNIVCDSSDNPHIAFIIERDTTESSNSGNFAVQYATLSGSSFTVSQVSTNSTDPTDNSNNEYNCYINGRPEICLENGTILVSYISDSSSLTSYDKYIIFARKSGSSWNRTQEINVTDEISGTYDVDDGFSLPAVTNDMDTAGVIEISNYSPRILVKSTTWSDTEISGYAGTFDNSHVQLVNDDNGVLHYLWFNDENEQFCHTTVTGTSYSTVKKASVSLNPAGNLYPSTVDLSTGKPVHFYGESLSSDGGLIIYDESGIGTEHKLTDIGEAFGRRVLHADDGYVSLVTADDDEDLIYITIYE